MPTALAPAARRMPLAGFFLQHSNFLQVRLYIHVYNVTSGNNFGNNGAATKNAFG